MSKRKPRRSREFKKNSQVIDIEEARRQRREKRQKAAKAETRKRAAAQQEQRCCFCPEKGKEKQKTAGLCCYNPVYYSSNCGVRI